MTSCFVYKVMGLTFHHRINTQLIYKIEIAQVVARRITKPHRTFFRFESHWLLFFIHFFLIFFLEGRGRSDFIILFMSYFFLFIYFFIIFFIFYPFNMYKGTYIKTSVTTQASVNSEIHANVSVKRHICDVKICD